MQISIKANTMRESAKIFLEEYPQYEIYVIVRETPNNYKNKSYLVTGVPYGKFSKSKLSRYNLMRK